MKRTAIGAACLVGLFVSVHETASARVDVSLNVFPTSLGNPSGGGNWTLVALTDNPNGIVAINALLQDVDNGRIVDGDPQNDITLSDDIGAIDPIAEGRPNEQPPYLDLGGGATDLIYGQSISEEETVVTMVGTLASSDGPDPLGDPAWDDATIIAQGTYSGAVPSFNGVDANELSTLVPPYTAMAAIPTTSVVRVAVPETSTAVLGVWAIVAMGCRRRRH